MPQETHVDDDGLYRLVAQPYSPAQESDSEEADHGETPRDQEILDIEKSPTSGRTCVDNPDYYEFQDLINHPWQPWYGATPSNRPSDSLNPTITSHKLIVT